LRVPEETAAAIHQGPTSPIRRFSQHSVAASNNQLPNRGNLSPEFQLTGVSNFPSADINSFLNFRDYLGILSLNGAPAPGLTYQVAYSAHYISQKFEPDEIGELIYQGAASTAFHSDFDNTLQGDLTYNLGAHTLGTGFYLGEYAVEADDNSLVFNVDSAGNQEGPPFFPVRVINNANKINLLSGIYLEDTRQITEKLRANVGVRWDRLSGFTYNNQIDPTVKFCLHGAAGHHPSHRFRPVYASAELSGYLARRSRGVRRNHRLGRNRSRHA
jgi:outer membrane receptor protein involved in Fe transport